MNWEEFLNRKIGQFENEIELAKSLVSGNYYCCGKRLVRFCYEIPYLRIIVCDMAKLSPEPQPKRAFWGNQSSKDSVSLDESDEKKPDDHIIKKPIQKVEGDVYV